MKLYWDTLRRPTQNKWYRRFLFTFIAAANIPNLFVMIVDMPSMKPTVWWNAAAFLFCVAVLVGHMFLWAWEDTRNRPAAPIITTTAATFLAPPDIIPITRPEDAADPFAFALMAAFNGERASIYRDDEGVWRDSITDAVLPVQEPDEEDK